MGETHGVIIVQFGNGTFGTVVADVLRADNRGTFWHINNRFQSQLFCSPCDPAPMIAIWDDHEFANDTWSAGAENHQPGEGDFAMRKAAAMQAYHEWMPTRTASAELIYRSFDFGDLVSLHMLDTRVIGRDTAPGRRRDLA